MSEQNKKFQIFLATVEERYQEFVVGIHDYLMQNDCKCEVKSAKSGFLVSYVLRKEKRTVASFTPRKSGMKLRIYPWHLSQYADYLNTLPEPIKRDIKKSSACKKLINPNDCNPRCIAGYDFFMDGERYQKCRYMAFMPTLSEDNNPYIKGFLEREIDAR